MVIESASFVEILLLEGEARVISTDSRGVQKEAYLFRVPCVTLLDETEWDETVETGWNKVVGATRMKAIRQAALDANPDDTGICPFGTGAASQKICNVLIRM